MRLVERPLGVEKKVRIILMTPDGKESKSFTLYDTTVTEVYTIVRRLIKELCV